MDEKLDFDQFYRELTRDYDHLLMAVGAEVHTFEEWQDRWAAWRRLRKYRVPRIYTPLELAKPECGHYVVVNAPEKKVFPKASESEYGVIKWSENYVKPPKKTLAQAVKDLKALAKAPMPKIPQIKTSKKTQLLAGAIKILDGTYKDSKRPSVGPVFTEVSGAYLTLPQGLYNHFVKMMSKHENMPVSWAGHVVLPVASDLTFPSQMSCSEVVTLVEAEVEKQFPTTTPQETLGPPAGGTEGGQGAPFGYTMSPMGDLWHVINAPTVINQMIATETQAMAKQTQFKELLAIWQDGSKILNKTDAKKLEQQVKKISKKGYQNPDGN